jgi:acyl-CoA synthetase (NDP forming)
VTQSGGLGLALASQLSRLGIGISSFASVGGKLDVSSNDLLLWWEHDGTTRLAILYIDSFGNPRKFSRTARRVAATMPVLTVLPGRPAAGQQAAASPAAAVATPLASRQALFEQAGIITAQGLGELTGAAALLATQPAPAGRTVAIISNVAAAGVLAVGACTGQGLAVHRPHGSTRQRLRALVPDGGAVTGPVDTTATMSGDAFRQCLELLSAAGDADAIIALVLPTAATGGPHRRHHAGPAQRPDRGRAARPAGIGPAPGRRGRQPDTGLRLPGGRRGRDGPRRRLRHLARRTRRPGTRTSRHLDRPGAGAGARLPLPRPRRRLAAGQGSHRAAHLLRASTGAADRRGQRG